MAQSKRRPIAVFLISKLRKLGNFIFKVKGIRADIDANPLIYVTPTPPTAQINTDIVALEAEQTKVKQRVPGSVATRDIAYSKVMEDINNLLGYVQKLADGAANEQEAIALITTAGFNVKIKGVVAKDNLSAKNTKATGTIKLIAKSAAPRASYNWQMSSNNGATWLDLPQTLKARTVATGLVSGTRMMFRFNAITALGTSDWSVPVSVVVL